jgi:exodeoxyribonuclease VII small subunit
VAKTPELPADIQAMSYEQARDELVNVVSSLEQGNIPLDESIALWERGEALAVRCERWLSDARSRLEKARSARDDWAQ